MNDLTQMLMDAGFEYTSDLLANMHKFKKLVEIEREACAKICDETNNWPIAHAIRARGN